MGAKAKRLFLIFSYLTLILVVAAFGSIVANTFMATYTETGAVNVAASSANATTAMISILFIVIAIAFGFLVYRRNAGLAVSTMIGIVAIIICMTIGIHCNHRYHWLWNHGRSRNGYSCFYRIKGYSCTYRYLSVQ